MNDQEENNPEEKTDIDILWDRKDLQVINIPRYTAGT